MSMYCRLCSGAGSPTSYAAGPPWPSGAAERGARGRRAAGAALFQRPRIRGIAVNEAVTLTFLWVGLCIAVGLFANRYQRWGFGWFLMSMIVSPLLGSSWRLAGARWPEGHRALPETA